MWVPLGFLRGRTGGAVLAGGDQAASSFVVAPSLTLLGSPGPYELAAYVVAAAATYGIGRWQLAGRWPHSTAPRLATEALPVRTVVLGLGAAASILLATAAWEANRIINAVG